jgi:hypothetical protein
LVDRPPGSAAILGQLARRMGGAQRYPSRDG